MADEIDDDEEHRDKQALLAASVSATVVATCGVVQSLTQDDTSGFPTVSVPVWRGSTKFVGQDMTTNESKSHVSESRLQKKVQ
jgi:hypothetical protein